MFSSVIWGRAPGTRFPTLSKSRAALLQCRALLSCPYMLLGGCLNIETKKYFKIIEIEGREWWFTDTESLPFHNIYVDKILLLEENIYLNRLRRDFVVTSVVYELFRYRNIPSIFNEIGLKLPLVVRVGNLQFCHNLSQENLKRTHLSKYLVRKLNLHTSAMWSKISSKFCGYDKIQMYLSTLCTGNCMLWDLKPSSLIPICQPLPRNEHRWWTQH